MLKQPKSRPVRPGLAAAWFVLAALLGLSLPGAGAAQHEHGHEAGARPAAAAPQTPASVERWDGGRSQRLVQDGVVVELFLEQGGSTAVPAVEGRSALLRLRLTDEATGSPLTDRHPVTWIDRRRGAGPTELEQCRQKITTYAEGTLRARPAVDLNSYHVLALTTEGTILVIDPIVGFGRTRLLTSVPLGPAEDWAATPDGLRLLVTQPARDRIAVVDTDTWRVLDRIDAGSAPRRLLVQPDGRGIWVTLANGVAVLDAASLEVAARYPTDSPVTTIAFSPDSRLAFLLMPEAQRVAVIDVPAGTVLRELSTGPEPTDLGISPAAAAVFVTHADGLIGVIDGGSLGFTGYIRTAPGARSIRFPPADVHAHHGHGQAPDRGRFGYVMNPVANTVHVIDALTATVVHTIDVPAGPDQVGFTASFAHLRSARSAQVRMLPLSDPTSNATGALDVFDAGFAPPGFSTVARVDDLLVQAPEMPDALFVANPKERMIYYMHYMEGMPVPAGGLTTYGYEPVAIRLAGRNLRETEPGTYTATVSLPDQGDYDFILLLSEPRVVHCFDFEIEADPARRAAAPQLVMDPLSDTRLAEPGPEPFRFRLLERADRSSRDGIEDVLVVVTRADGWSRRTAARPLDGGGYEVDLGLPGPGSYYLVFQVPSLGLDLSGRAPILLRVGQP
jgi:YVTN family beta-propeller protein